MDQGPTTPSGLTWNWSYWKFALLPGWLLYLFEAFQLTFYPVTRAPNVGLMTQLLLFFLFFSAFALALRVAFSLVVNARGNWRDPGLLARLGLSGAALSLVHLAFLALILRFMHSPPGWTIGHLLDSAGEVWLGNAGIWLLVYAACCGALMIWNQHQDKARPLPVRLEVRQGEKLLSLKVHDIAWIESSGNYVEIHGPTGTSLQRESLARMEALLGPAGFIRSHRRALVNMRKVHSIQTSSSKPLSVCLEGGHHAPLSRRRMKEFRQHLNKTSLGETELLHSEG